MAKILVVDDNVETLQLIRDVLESERHVADSCNDGLAAWDYIKTYEYDLLIFDWEMPEMSGIELLEKYRSSGGKTPVLMLTGRNATMDKIKGLDNGADNYLTKPFERDELLSFIRAVLRRGPEERNTSISWGDLQVFPESNTVTCSGKTAVISSRELAVLKLLLENANRLISHEELKLIAWSDAPDTSSGTIRVFLTGLREKLNSIGSQIKIINVRGYGYQIKI